MSELVKRLRSHCHETAYGRGLDLGLTSEDVLEAANRIEELEAGLRICAPWYCEEHCLPKAGMHTTECKANYALLNKEKKE